MSDKLKHAMCVAALVVVGLGLRYVSSWSWTDPVDPTRQALQLGPRVVPEFAPSPMIVARDSRQTTWEVAYVTARESASVHDGRLRFGLTDVSLPQFRARGSLPLVPSAKGEEVITRSSDEDLSEEAFYRHLDAKLAETADRNLLVFVHGYNVSFEEAVCRAAQMAEDMPFSGVVLAYDWNSQARTLGYLQDRWTTGQTHGQLAWVLAQLHSRLSPGTRLHVLSHSMGNRLTLKALQALENQRTLIGAGPSPMETPDVKLLQPQFPGWKPPTLGGTRPPPLTHLVFAAPDVDPESFQSALREIETVAANVTLYCSDSDFALEMSRIVNLQGKTGYRSGDSRGAVRGARLQTIRLTGVSRSDPFGHSYYGSHPGLLTDLAQLLQKDLAPPQRPTVTAGQWPEVGTWRLR